MPVKLPDGVMIAMNPIYQGQVDVFCAAYAVINAIRRIHESRLLHCRELLHEALLDAAANPEYFATILKQQTDYASWVDSMLERQVQRGTLYVEKPFSSTGSHSEAIPPERLWETLEQWLNRTSRRAVIFQFIRHLIPTQLVIRHWSCGYIIQEDILSLLDSSLEPGSVHSIPKKNLVTDESQGVTGKILIVPHTVRLLCASSDRRLS